MLTKVFTSKKIAKVILASALFFSYIGCFSHESAEIEKRIEGWLKVDIPSNFQVLRNNYSFAPGDDVWTVDIEYPPEAFKAFLTQIDISQWKKVQFGFQLVLQKDLPEGGYAFFSISVSPNQNRVINIQYGNE